MKDLNSVLPVTEQDSVDKKQAIEHLLNSDGAFDVESLQPETVKKQGLNLSLGTPQNPKVNTAKSKNMTCCFMLQFSNVYNPLHEIHSL